MDPYCGECGGFILKESSPIMCCNKEVAGKFCTGCGRGKTSSSSSSNPVVDLAFTSSSEEED